MGCYRLKSLPVPAYVKVEGPLLRAFLTGYRLAQVALLPTPCYRHLETLKRNKDMWRRGPNIPSSPTGATDIKPSRLVHPPCRLAPNFSPTLCLRRER